MKIVIKYPPNIEKIKKVFPIREGTVFTYGDIIYNPSNGFVDESLVYHEATHTLQQGKDIEVWWDRYMVDKDFRFAQELEAYQNQYKHFCKLFKDRNIRYKFLVRIATDLASPMYGSICSVGQAAESIKSGLSFRVMK